MQVIENTIEYFDNEFGYMRFHHDDQNTRFHRPEL